MRLRATVRKNWAVVERLQYKVPDSMVGGPEDLQLRTGNATVLEVLEARKKRNEVKAIRRALNNVQNDRP